MGSFSKAARWGTAPASAMAAFFSGEESAESHGKSTEKKRKKNHNEHPKSSQIWMIYFFEHGIAGMLGFFWLRIQTDGYGWDLHGIPIHVTWISLKTVWLWKWNSMLASMLIERNSYECKARVSKLCIVVSCCVQILCQRIRLWLYSLRCLYQESKPHLWVKFH